MKFRSVIFWSHLIAGVVAGIVIFVMSFTGVVLAFEKEIVAWADRDTLHVAPPSADSQRLPLEEIFARVREVQKGRPSGATVYSDPHLATVVSFGRTNSFYANPYTGEVRKQGAEGVRDFMSTMIELHRYLGTRDDKRPVGKAITGACNFVFFFLAVSGLYIWWPRNWSRNALRPSVWFVGGLRGKARDWNWHNTIGLWSAPILIVLTITALPISYRWAGDLIYKIAGTEPPAQGSGPGGAPTVEIPQPPQGSRPLGFDTFFATTKMEVPDWKEITLRSGAGGGRGARSTGGATNAPAADAQRSGETRNVPQPVTAAVKVQRNWPLFASTQITFDPFTGEVLRKESFDDYNLGRQVRSWTRFLHTGEALGTIGQFVAGLASAGGVILVWTGFALAWRRFLGRKNGKAANTTTATNQEAVVK